MSTETEIQTEVEALKTRFSDTKLLYREFCALLFFRHGITPTTNKHYQYVRKGSMSAPADALNNFWEELRSKARIEIDHPDLPSDVKDAAATAIATLWRQASAAARDELRVLRDDVSQQLVSAQTENHAALSLNEQLRGKIDSLQADLDKSDLTVQAIRTELESERRAHAATAARHLEVQRSCDDLRAQGDRQRADFTGELAKARVFVDQANDRADAAERRALLEIDHERQARLKSDKTVEGLRIQVANLESAQRDSEATFTKQVAQLTAALESSEHARSSMAASCDSANANLESSRLELAGVRENLIRTEAEARTVQAVLDKLAAGGSVPPSAARRTSPDSKRKPSR